MKSTRLLSFASAVATACLALNAGCGPSGTHGTPPGPRGSDGTFNFSWLINGVDPADASDPCTRSNIRFIKMVIVDYNDVAMHDDSFAFDCRLGHYASAQPELRAGTYRVYWEADGADGTMISSTFMPTATMPAPAEVINVAHGTNVDFDAENRPDPSYAGAPTNFATGSDAFADPVFFVSGAGDTMGSACAGGAVATVAYTLRASNHVVQTQQTAHVACSPTLAFPDLVWDNYSLDVDGFDATGTQRWHGHCENQVHTQPFDSVEADAGETAPPAASRCVIAPGGP